MKHNITGNDDHAIQMRSDILSKRATYRETPPMIHHTDRPLLSLREILKRTTDPIMQTRECKIYVPSWTGLDALPRILANGFSHNLTELRFIIASNGREVPIRVFSCFYGEAGGLFF